MNNRLKHLLLSQCLLLVSLLNIACGDDDSFTESAPTLAVVSSDVVFDAAAGQGVITVSNALSGSHVVATTDRAWCTVSVSESDVATLTVGVTRYEGYEGRHAVVTVSNGVDELRVPVSQQGALWALDGAEDCIVDDEAQLLELRFRSDFDHTVSLPSWVTSTETNGKLTLSVEQNTTGAPRQGRIVVDSHNAERGKFEFLLAQYDARDLPGTYEAEFTAYTGELDEDGELLEDDDGNPLTARYQRQFQLVRGANDSVFLAQGLSSHPQVPVQFVYSHATRRLSVHNGVRLFNEPAAQNYYYAIMMFQVNRLLFNTNLSYTSAPLALQASTTLPLFEFEQTPIAIIDGDNVIETVLDGFYVYALSAPSLTMERLKNYRDMYRDLVIRRIQ